MDGDSNMCGCENLCRMGWLQEHYMDSFFSTYLLDGLHTVAISCGVAVRVVNSCWSLLPH
jgi:hypothetical protein